MNSGHSISETAFYTKKRALYSIKYGT